MTDPSVCGAAEKFPAYQGGKLLRREDRVQKRHTADDKKG